MVLKPSITDNCFDVTEYKQFFHASVVIPDTTLLKLLKPWHILCKTKAENNAEEGNLQANMSVLKSQILLSISSH